MRKIRHFTRLLLATAAISIAVPTAVVVAQNAAPAKVPSTPQPPYPDMPPLSDAEIAARSGRGGGGGQAAPFNWSVSTRSDFDKQLQNPYVADMNWYQMPAGRFLGGVSGIDTDRDGASIWIAERCGGINACDGQQVDMIMKIGEDGKIKKMFGKNLINYPHGLFVDRDNNIWVTDTWSNVMPTVGGSPAPNPNHPHPGGAQVIKFDQNGKILLRIGKPGIYGTGPELLSQPSDVVTDSKGNIYVADAHDTAPANNRIAKYDKNGKYLMEWRSCHPSQARQIDCSHSIEIDSQDRIFVANRANNVIQIYDTNGKMLAVWPHFGKPTGLMIDDDDNLYVADSQTGAGNGNGFVKGTHVGSARTGEVKWFIPDPLGNSAPWTGAGTLSPESVTALKDGRIITASVRPQGLYRWSISKNTKPFPALPTPGGPGGGGAARPAAGGGGD